MAGRGTVAISNIVYPSLDSRNCQLLTDPLGHQNARLLTAVVNFAGTKRILADQSIVSMAMKPRAHGTITKTQKRSLLKIRLLVKLFMV